MTFSQSAKEEILRHIHYNKSCCGYACLYSVLRCLGSYQLVPRSIAMTVSSENNKLVHIACDIAKTLFDSDIAVSSATPSTLRNNAVYSATFDRKILEFFGLVYTDNEGSLQLGSSSWASGIENSQCCTTTLLATAFVSCGSVVIPDQLDNIGDDNLTKRYHMEMVFGNDSIANHILDILLALGFNWRSTTRKGNTVLYIKDSETIADMLAYFGAPSSRLALDNVMIERAVRNTANRQSNCITANIDKAVNATRKHIQAIEILIENNTLQTLPTQLQEIASIRLDNPEATLLELATMCGVSKSGIRHRLNKLVELADIQGEYNG